MNEFNEMKIRGYAHIAGTYLEKPILTKKEKDLLEDVFYHLYEIEERELSGDITKLRSKLLEQIAIKRRLV
jgi:hypothetical protein